MTLDAASIALLAALGAFASKVTSFLKLAKATDWSGLRAQLATWAAGVAAPYLASATDINAAIQPVSGAGKAFLGVLIGSVASVVYDLRTAIDSSDSAAEPPL